jgi:hypothetical protein
MGEPRWEIEGNLLEGAAAGKWSHQVNVVVDNSAFRCVRCQHIEKVASCSNCSGPWFTGGYGSGRAVALVCMNCQVAQTRWLCPRCGTDNSIRNSFGKIKSGSCFIATAAFEDVRSPEVVALRAFRDDTLANYKLGRAAILAYNRISPPLADIVSRSASLKRALRAVLCIIVKVVQASG